MSPAFLEGGFHTPAFHEVHHDLLSRLRRVGGEERFGRPLCCGVAGEHPANGQWRRAEPVPAGGATAPLQRAFTFAIPLQREAFPDRARVLQYLLEGGKGSRLPTTRGRPMVWRLRTGAGWCIMASKPNGAIKVMCWRAQCTPRSRML